MVDYFSEIDKTLKQIPKFSFNKTVFNNNFMQGDYPSKKEGDSIEFNYYNPYTPGEDVKKIDWKVYAKNEKFFIKKNEREINNRFLITFDKTKSMLFKNSSNFTKLDYSYIVGGVLTYMFLEKHDSIAHLMGRNGDNKPYFSGFRNSKKQFFPMIDLLSNSSSEIEISELLSYIENMNSLKGVTLIIFSDFLFPIDDILKRLSYLKASGMEIYLIQVIDDTEVNLDYRDMVKFIDMETGEEVITDASEVASVYKKEFQSHFNKILNFSYQYKVPVFQFNTKLKPEENILNILKGEK